MGRPAELSDFRATAEYSKQYTDSKIEEVRAVTTNTYNCDFSTSLSKLLAEISMSNAHYSASYNLILDGLSERARESLTSSYFLIVINTTGQISTNFEAKCICTDAQKMPTLKYVIDVDAKTFQLYAIAPTSVFDFNYRVLIQSMRNSVEAQNIIRNEDVDEIPIGAVDLPIVQYAFSNNVEELQNEVADLKAYIGYTDSDIYGLEADFENNKFTRLAGAVGKTPGADFDSIRAFGGRKRCAVANDGNVLAYYGDAGYDGDGWNNVTAQDEQIMVEQPKFYYKVVPLKTEKIDGADGYHLRKARYYISDTPKAGFKVHPAFVRDGVEVDRIYLSAFEGSIKNGGQYLANDEQLSSFGDTDKLSSIPNAKPASGTTQPLTRANARKLAQNRGAGWGITTVQTLSATQLLFMIEYATFNAQTAIGRGAANTTIKMGSTSSFGNTSGSVSSGGVSYRGEENLWGNTYMWVDGIELDVSEPFSADGFSRMAIDDMYVPVANINSYISAWEYTGEKDWLFVPTEGVGNTALPIGDTICIVSSGHKIACFGGNNGIVRSAIGLFHMDFSKSNTDHTSNIGARLIYIPPTTATQEVTAND